jgi:MOSC domain-containing protein YiiM
MALQVPVGRIVRLQVQRSPLKHGPLGRRWYDPSPITQVSQLLLAPGGVLGASPDHGSILDVHHRDHPAGKNQGYHDISVVFSSHYEMMRERFGARAVPGIAGENILVEAPRRLRLQDIAGGILLETEDGRTAELEVVKVAEPCVEFTRYLMQRPPDAPATDEFLAGLDFLRYGMRGFYCRYAGEPVSVRAGDQVHVRGAA